MALCPFGNHHVRALSIGSKLPGILLLSTLDDVLEDQGIDLKLVDLHVLMM